MDRQFLGRRVRLLDLDATAVERFVAECLDPVPGAGDEAAAADGPTITLRGVPSAVPDAVDLGSATVGPWGTRHLRAGPDEFWVVEDGGGVHGTVGADGADLVLHGRPFTARRALHAAFAEAMTASGRLRLHTAVVADGRRVALLLGPSGRGKSTTVLRGLRAGWRPVAEDSCWLDPATLRVHRADRFLRLRPEGLAWLRSVRPDLRPGPLVDGKHEIPLDRLDGGAGTPSALTDLVLLVRTDDPTPAWSPLAPTTAVMALHQAAGIPHTARAGTVLTTAFADLVPRLHRHTLTLGAPDRPLPPLPDTP